MKVLQGLRVQSLCDETSHEKGDREKHQGGTRRVSPVAPFFWQVRHDVVHLIYMHYLLVLDRHDDVSCTDKGGRTEGGREARPGSTGGVIISRAV